MLLLGVLCLAYYVWMGILLKKWDSTFAWFWIVAGAVCFLLSTVNWKPYVPVFVVCLVVFVAAEVRIMAGMIPCKERNLPYFIVLGAQVKGTRMSGSLYRRVEKAREYLVRNPETVVIVSGGQGKGEEITEAEAMRRYLTEQGIEESRIFPEECSTTTEENLEFSARFIEDKNLPVGIVTNNFHAYRACCYARRLGYGAPRAVPAGCHPVFFVHYMVREFFALCKMLLTKRRRVL